MKRKYFSALLMGALTIASVSTFTSCKDYDDDIDNLQSQIDKAGLQSDIDALKTQLQDAASTASAAKTTAESALAKANDAAVKADVEKAIQKVEVTANKAATDVATAISNAANAQTTADGAQKAADAAAKAVRMLRSKLTRLLRMPQLQLLQLTLPLNKLTSRRLWSASVTWKQAELQQTSWMRSSLNSKKNSSVLMVTKRLSVA